MPADPTAEELAAAVREYEEQLTLFDQMEDLDGEALQLRQQLREGLDLARSAHQALEQPMAHGSPSASQGMSESQDAPHLDTQPSVTGGAEQQQQPSVVQAAVNQPSASRQLSAVQKRAVPPSSNPTTAAVMSAGLPAPAHALPPAEQHHKRSASTAFDQPQHHDAPLSAYSPRIMIGPVPDPNVRPPSAYNNGHSAFIQGPTLYPAALGTSPTEPLPHSAELVATGPVGPRTLARPIAETMDNVLSRSSSGLSRHAASQLPSPRVGAQDISTARAVLGVTPMFIPPPSFSDDDSLLLSESPASVHELPPHHSSQQGLPGPVQSPHSGPVLTFVSGSRAASVPASDDGLQDMEGCGDREGEGAGSDADPVPVGNSSGPNSVRSGRGPGEGGHQWPSHPNLPALGGQSPPPHGVSPPGPWSAWWNANKGQPAAAYGGSISAWLSGAQGAHDAHALARTSTDGSSVDQVVKRGKGWGRASTGSTCSRTSSWSFDSAEQLAIAAAVAEAEDHTMTRASGDGDVEYDAPVGAGLAFGGQGGITMTAAAARAAAWRAKASGRPGAAVRAAAAGHRGTEHSLDNRIGSSAVIQSLSQQPQHPQQPWNKAKQDHGAAAWVQEQPTGRTGRNNARMHPNNRYYQHEPDFLELAKQYPELKEYITLPRGAGGRAVFDFTSWEGTRQLTATLLKADFDITWWLPEGQLVPTLTNRANYLHWLQDLLNLSSPPGPIRGLDIGCGANFIYCLLGAAMHGWHMVGVDVTEVACTWATRNMRSNPQLAHLLEVRQSHDPSAKAGLHTGDVGVQDLEQDGVADVGGILTPALYSDTETFAFTMCNPPFFASIEEANSNPHTACGGTAAEMVYPGGELAFIMRMVEDSVRLGPRVHWYSSMVGKKVTLKALRKELHLRHVTAIRTTEFAQGKTSRWAIAWSFDVDRNLANVPLARPVQPQRIEVGTVPRHSVSFSIKPNKMDARGLLQLISSLLSAQGATCSIDAAQWRVTAALPMLPASTGVAGSTASSGAGSAGASAAAAGDVVEAALLAELTREKLDAHNARLVQASKKARGAPDDGDGGEDAAVPCSSVAVAAPASAVSIRVNVFQQQKGQYEVAAAVAGNTPEPGLAKFAQLMCSVQEDLQTMCS